MAEEKPCWERVACVICGSDITKPLFNFDYTQQGIKEPFHIVKCHRCGLVYNTPRLTEEWMNKLYDKNYYVFDKSREEYYLQKAKVDYQKIEMLKMRPGKLLEVGCSKGYLLDIAKRKGWEVRGVEISSYAARFATTNFEIPVHQGTIENLEPHDGYFDLIVAIDVIEHSRDPLEFLKACRKKMKAEGALLIDTPNIGSIFYRLSGKNWYGFNPYHIYSFNLKQLRKLAEMSNLYIIRCFTTKNEVFSVDGLNRLRKCFNQNFLGRRYIYILLSKLRIGRFVNTLVEKFNIGDQFC